MNGRRGSGSGYEYPDPTNLAPVTPVSTGGYQPHTPGPYYQPPPLNDVRPPPQYPYPYDARHSSSPHSSPYPPMHSQGTPSPSSLANSINGARGGLNVRDMLNPGDQNREAANDQTPRSSSTDLTEGRSSVDQSQGRSSDQNQGRSSTDSDMLNALNRRGLNR